MRRIYKVCNEKKQFLRDEVVVSLYKSIFLRILAAFGIHYGGNWGVNVIFIHQIQIDPH